MADLNLGHVTAYGYAKSKGYTGTEEEFAQTMLELSDAIDTAQEAAEDAEGFADSAEGFADDASASATEASNSATTVINKIDQAETIMARATSIGNKRYVQDYLYSGSTTVESVTFNPTGYVYSSTDIFSIYVGGEKLNAGTNVYSIQSSGNSAVITFNPVLTVQANEAIEVIADTEVPITTDVTLSLNGAAADAKATGDALTELRDDLDNIEPISEDIKIALLNCFGHVAWIDAHGQDYYDALEDALYPDTGLVRITAVFTQGSAVIYPSTPLDELKAYLVITGYYNNGTTRTITDYALSGTLEVGTSTITVSKEMKTDTFTVIVSAGWDYEWDASSGTIPSIRQNNGGTCNFTTYPGYLYCTGSDTYYFDYIGDCEYVFTGFVPTQQQNLNPQLVLVHNENGSLRDGFKVCFNSNPNHRIATSLSGTIVENSANIDQTIEGNYRLKWENGVGYFYYNDTLVESGQGVTNNAYLGGTGINVGSFSIAIKNLKFRRL